MTTEEKFHLRILELVLLRLRYRQFLHLLSIEVAELTRVHIGFSGPPLLTSPWTWEYCQYQTKLPSFTFPSPGPVYTVGRVKNSRSLFSKRMNLPSSLPTQLRKACHCSASQNWYEQPYLRSHPDTRQSQSHGPRHLTALATPPNQSLGSAWHPPNQILEFPHASLYQYHTLEKQTHSCSDTGGACTPDLGEILQRGQLSCAALLYEGGLGNQKGKRREHCSVQDCDFRLTARWCGRKR